MGKLLKSCLSGACSIFTALILIFYLFGHYASAARLPAMTGEMVTALFVASLCFSFSSLVLKINKIHKSVAYPIHCVCCVAAAFFLYVNVLGKAATPSGKMVCIVLTLVIYAIVMLVRGLILSVIEKRKDK